MKKVFLDTNAYSAMLYGNDPGLIKVLREAEHIAINTIVLAELYAGFKCGTKEEQNLIELKQFLDSPRVHVLHVNEVTAEYYSRIYKQLRDLGNPVPTNDLWIASSVVEHGYMIYTKDKHFKSIPGLICI